MNEDQKKEEPIKLYDTKKHGALLSNDNKFSLEYIKEHGNPEWDVPTGTVHIGTCNRCRWRFAWKGERKYCSDDCRYDRKGTKK